MYFPIHIRIDLPYGFFTFCLSCRLTSLPFSCGHATDRGEGA